MSRRARQRPAQSCGQVRDKVNHTDSLIADTVKGAKRQRGKGAMKIKGLVNN